MPALDGRAGGVVLFRTSTASVAFVATSFFFASPHPPPTPPPKIGAGFRTARLTMGVSDFNVTLSSILVLEPVKATGLGVKNENRVCWPFFCGKEVFSFAGFAISVGAGFSCNFGSLAIGASVGAVFAGDDGVSCNLSVVPPLVFPATGVMFVLAFCGSSAVIFIIFACSGDLLRFFGG